MTRPPLLRAGYAFPGELTFDFFAGGGGASAGVERALGRPVDIAINHSPEAIAMHKANHPDVAAAVSAAQVERPEAIAS